jgi:thiol-disulfide isomerase/thioredoxin
MAVSCNKKSHDVLQSQRAYSLMIYDKFTDLAPKIFNNSDTTYVVNFWATSCPPCLREMPHFNKLELDTKGKPIKIYLVSLDLIKDTETRVRPFIAKHKILPQVIHLRDDYYSIWIDKIDASWYGALPATLMIKGQKRNFTFGAFETYEDVVHAMKKVN